MDNVFYTKLSIDNSEQKPQGVLATVTGILMEFGVTNGNVREYPVEVAKEKILGSSYVQDLMKNRLLLGETNHPEDRDAIWIKEASHIIREMWLTEDEKYLMGKVDVLDTPMGRIIKTLIDYGSAIGISARANGGVRKKPEGGVVVDVDTYQFYTFDFTTNPGFSSAHLIKLNESLEVTVSDECPSDSLLKGLQRLVEENSSNLELLDSIKSSIALSDIEDAQNLVKEIDTKLESTEPNNDVITIPRKVYESMKQDINAYIDCMQMYGQVKQELKDYKEAEHQISSMVDEGIRNNDELTRLQYQLIDTKSELTQCYDNIADLTEKNGKLKEQILDLERSLSSRDSDYYRLEDNYFRASSKVEELESKLSKILLDNKSIKDNLETLETSNVRLTEELKSFLPVKQQLNESLDEVIPGVITVETATSKNTNTQRLENLIKRVKR